MCVFLCLFCVQAHRAERQRNACAAAYVCNVRDAQIRHISHEIRRFNHSKVPLLLPESSAFALLKCRFCPPKAPLWHCGSTTLYLHTGNMQNFRLSNFYFAIFVCNIFLPRRRYLHCVHYIHNTNKNVNVNIQRLHILGIMGSLYPMRLEEATSSQPRATPWDSDIRMAMRPVRAKVNNILMIIHFCPYRALLYNHLLTQGAALGWLHVGLSARKICAIIHRIYSYFP